nr:12735_t:CDS:2 [Entrophospora candida]
MISSILENENQFLKIDHCINRNNGDFQLLLEKNEVLQATYNIDEQWYKNIMLVPTFSEYFNVIKSLAVNKATGPSNISNEMLKHLGQEMQKALWKYISICIISNNIPDNWNLATVFPIPNLMTGN